MIEAFVESLDAVCAFSPVWKLAFIFLFMAVESSFIPFPSEIVMIPAGFMAGRMLPSGGTELGTESSCLSLLLVVALGTAGSLAGAYVNYFLSVWLGKPFLERYGRYFFIKPIALSRACDLFNRYGAATTFVCRLIPVIRQLISIPAGISRMPLGSFTVFTALGAGIWTALLALAGFALAGSAADLTYREIVFRGKELAANNLPWVILCAAVLAGLYWLAGKLAMGTWRRQ